jgi:hypothetical protein
MAVLRTEVKDYGGVECFESRDPDSPIYLAPHLLPEMFADGELTAAGVIFVDNIVINRAESNEVPDGLYAD